MSHTPKNLLDIIPVRSKNITWTRDNGGFVTLVCQNKGFFNRLFQLILKKPPASSIHLDELGSAVWCLADGKNDIFTIANRIKKRFGDFAEPLYERLTKYFSILESYGFVDYKR